MSNFAMVDAPPITRREAIQQGIQLVAVLAVVFLAVKLVGFDAIQEKILSAGAWGPVMLIFAKAATLVIAPLGGSPLYPIAGLLYGFSKGIFYMFLGDLLGSALCFYISRLFGKPVMRHFVGAAAGTIDAILKYLGTTRGLFHARIMFFTFPEGVAYAAGLTRIPFLRFIAVHMGTGIIPIVILTAFGSFLIENPNPLFIVLATIIGGLLALAGGWWFYRIARQRTLNNYD